MTFSLLFNNLYSLFSTIQIKDFFDIAIIAAIIYLIFIFIKETRSFFIFNAIITLLAVAYISKIFDLTLTNYFLQPFLTFLFVILVIVFQREIRRFFEWFAISGRKMALQKNISISQEVTNAVVRAVEIMANKKIGALIVFEGEHPLEHSIMRETILEGRISVPLLLSIFDTSSIGHDGAVIISNNKIKYFGAHLPLARHERNKEFTGTRHRAALGVAEETDALAIAVSEERGTVSLAYNGEIKEIPKENMRSLINIFVKRNLSEENKERGILYYLIFKNWIEKIFSIVLALIFWVLVLI